MATRTETKLDGSRSAVRVEGPAPAAIPAVAAGILGEIIRAYLAAHDLEATVELERREWTDEHPTARAGVRRVHPDEHRRSAVA